jgi:hypothetical protein
MSSFSTGVASNSAKLPLTVSELARAPILTVPGFVPVAAHFALVASVGTNIKMPQQLISICRVRPPKTASDSPFGKPIGVAVIVAPKQLGSLPSSQFVFSFTIYPTHLLESGEK